MHAMGQVSEMSGLPVSALRYYDKEDLFLGMLKFKCWYYEQAMKVGNEERLSRMEPEKIRKAYKNTHM